MTSITLAGTTYNLVKCANNKGPGSLNTIGTIINVMKGPTLVVNKSNDKQIGLHTMCELTESQIMGVSPIYGGTYLEINDVRYVLVIDDMDRNVIDTTIKSDTIYAEIKSIQEKIKAIKENLKAIKEDHKTCNVDPEFCSVTNQEILPESSDNLESVLELISKLPAVEPNHVRIVIPKGTKLKIPTLQLKTIILEESIVVDISSDFYIKDAHSDEWFPAEKYKIICGKQNTMIIINIPKGFLDY